MLSKRGTSFGYGTRAIFSMRRSTPSPGTYNLASDFDNPRIKGKTFGLSREPNRAKLSDYSLRYPIPGPGTYNVINKIGKDASKYSLGPRISYQGMILNTPGPGAYKTLDALTGQNFVSRFANSCAAVFSPPCSQRFLTPSKSR